MTTKKHRELSPEQREAKRKRDRERMRNIKAELKALRERSLAVSE